MPYKKPRKATHTVRVGRSSAGLGLFAEDHIKKGDFVIEYYGKLLTDEQADERGGAYLFEIDDQYTIDGSPRYNTARYINHSCKPNCEPEIDGKRIFVYAIRNIKPGEELTYHYGKTYFEDFIKPDGCRCCNHRKRKKR